MTDVRPARILIVEDEAVVALDIEERLRRQGYDVVGIADSADDAVAAAATLRPDLVLMDVQLRDGVDGVTAAERLRDELEVAVVFLTAFADDATLTRAKRVSPHGYILKPFDERDLRTTIEIALHRDGIERARRQSHEDVTAILDALRAGVLLVDAAGEVGFANAVARRMLGADGEELRGAPWATALGVAHDERLRIDVELHRPRPERAKVGVRLAARDGRALDVEIEAEDDPRDPAGRILFLYDVTEMAALRRLAQGDAGFHAIVGRGAAIQRVVQLIREVARVDATVLVLGETGTGKELVARAIHRESGRRDGPFVAVNCAGLSEELASSQLFGHRRGAFTGAVSDTPGVFEAANGGTLFLDEIGDLPARVQTVLLRVVEERAVTRLGDTRPRAVDVRIVAATSRDLGREAAEGRFRSDLLYRIRIGRITLPPLRERREDLWLLVQHALVEQRALTGRPVEGVGDEAMRALVAHEWPGNVRELQNALAFAVIHCRGRMIGLDDLPPEILDALRPPAAAPDLPADERARILEALARTGGERKAAAALLGIGRATLYRKLAQYGLG